MANERILVVDDEKGVVRSCTRILERQGFNVTGCTNSLLIPDRLRAETFDLLLTDIRMPRLDGLELLQMAKEINPHLTVILITGYGTMEDAIRAIRLGAEGFIMKPFEPEDLVQTVRDSLARRTLIHDSLRLKTLLPLLEINQILQISGGEMSLVQRILDIAHRQTSAARLAWLSRPTATLPPWVDKNNLSETDSQLTDVVVIPQDAPVSRLPTAAIEQVLTQAQPLWVLTDGSLIENIEGQPNVVGLLTAETGGSERTGPFDPISLNVLSVLAGQLVMIIENVQLFQQTKTLHAFNDDIIRTMTNGLIAVDKQGRITAFNPAAAIMLGHNREEVLHRPMRETLVGAEALIDVFEQALRNDPVRGHQEVTVQHWDGTRLPVSVNVALLTTEEFVSEPVGVVGVLEDLSERKMLEAERRRLDRLAALGEMSAVVAHEIRNPMAGIAAGVEYITRKISNDSPDFEGVGMIQSEIKRVNRILEDILFVARPLQLNRSEERLEAIIEDVIHRCQPQIQASQLRVYSNFTDTLPDLYLDRQRLEQVFTNLIINATQAMQSGGELRLEATLFSTNRQNSEQVVIIIADNGPGIPVDVHRRIFEPFFTTKTKGTGLGLPVARRIIEAHKGTIDIESEPEQGTRFIIKLPLEKGATP